MKYLKKFQTNADYQAFKSSNDYITPNVSVITKDDTIVFEPFVVPAAVFTFTVNGNQYQAEEGMTWQQFVDSEYNTVNELGDKSFKDVGTIQYGEVCWEYNPDGIEYYTEYMDVYKNDFAGGILFSDEYIIEDITYII